MTGSPQIALMPDGRRLHLQHGPIDIIACADGPAAVVNAAYQAAALRFQTILEKLVGELPLLRRQARADDRPSGHIARRMHAAVLHHASASFVTPMAAVAGSVAEELLLAMTAAAPSADRIYVNNGGDIALHLAGDRSFDIGLVGNADLPSIDGTIRIDATSPVRGIATSGWRGRSQSLGIADAVTVLADNAAAADVAATLIANAVNVDDSAITRAPASELRDDSDLGDRLVTVNVGPLGSSAIAEALENGLEAAERMLSAGLIRSAALLLQGEVRQAGQLQPDDAMISHGNAQAGMMTGRPA